MQKEWSSPDDRIFKKTLLPGIVLGLKPYETSTVRINILECSNILHPFNDKPLEIGNSDGELGRALDVCVCTMNLHERAFFMITIDQEQVSAIIELKELQFNGFIFQWDAKKKYHLALKHKERGAQLFSQKDQFEAAHRFTKGLKIISSIPVDVEGPPCNIDGISLSAIIKLKEMLLNNVASCYFRGQAFDMVVPLCKKVLAFNTTNVKAWYKIGVAYEHDKNFDQALEALSKVMEIEPQNKACAEHLANVTANVKKANTRVNDIMKKMVVESVGK